jgi:hypothetical protein
LQAGFGRVHEPCVYKKENGGNTELHGPKSNTNYAKTRPGRNRGRLLWP